MSARHVFSEAELEQLRRFPAINRAELIKHFTLTKADIAFLAQFRGQTSKLGAAVQLCTLPWLGFVPDDITTAPREAVARLSEQLVIGVSELGEYGDRAQTRTEQQTEQAWCLTLVTNAIVTWTTEYFGLAVAWLRHRGAFVDDELLAHIWPTRHANINFFGSITIDVDAEIAELNGNNGHRPLNGDADDSSH